MYVLISDKFVFMRYLKKCIGWRADATVVLPGCINDGTMSGMAIGINLLSTRQSSLYMSGKIKLFGQSGATCLQTYVIVITVTHVA